MKIQLHSTARLGDEELRTRGKSCNISGTHATFRICIVFAFFPSTGIRHLCCLSFSSYLWSSNASTPSRLPCRPLWRSDHRVTCRSTDCTVDLRTERFGEMGTLQGCVLARNETEECPSCADGKRCQGWITSTSALLVQMLLSKNKIRRRFDYFKGSLHTCIEPSL